MNLRSCVYELWAQNVRSSTLTRATGDRRKTIISISKVSDLHERRLGEEDFQTETPVKNKKMLDIQRRYDMANEI